MQRPSHPSNRLSRDGLATVDVHSVPGSVIVTLTGDHDLSTKQQVLKALAGVGASAKLIIDLTRCTFVDSTIINAILGASRITSPSRHTVSLVLPDDTSYVYRALSVIGMQGLVPIHQSIEAALR
jgi:anti-anti-sigma factor